MKKSTLIVCAICLLSALREDWLSEAAGSESSQISDIVSADDKPVFPKVGREDVTIFVRRSYTEGVPYEEARFYGDESLPVLQRMLADDTERQYWSNIVGVIGAIGGEEAAQTLINFIESLRGRPLDNESFRAGLSAIVGLGYAANLGECSILDYLTTTARGLLTSVDAPTTNGLQLDSTLIGQQAVQALALSGQERARETLLMLSTADEAPEDVRAAAEEALRTWKAVNVKGLSEYLER